MNVEEKAFIQFLIKHGAYTAFMRNLAYTRPAVHRLVAIKSWDKFKMEEKPEDWLICSFLFNEADFPKLEDDGFNQRRHDFWFDLHEEWNDIF